MTAARCGAQKRQGGDPCRQAAGWKTDHPGVGRCALHGGSSPSGKAAAARQLLDAEVAQILDREGVTPIDNPVAELQALAGRILRWEQILGDMVERLTEWTQTDLTGREDLRAIVAAFERAMTHSQSVLTSMARLNVDERLARISEAQTAILIQVVANTLAAPELGLDADGRRMGREILARELATVTAA